MRTVEMRPEESIMSFILGKFISKPIHVAAELGVADILAEGPKSVSDLAEITGTKAGLLFRLLRSLASVGIFVQLDDGRFDLTPQAECLRTGAMRSIALMFLSDWHDKAWGSLSDCLKTGHPAFELAHGCRIFDWFAENPEAAAIFNEANAVKAAVSHRAIIQSYDFSAIGCLTDVGGGYGALLAEILLAHPSMTGMVAERPLVVGRAEKYLEAKGLTGRAGVVSCDFFKKIPPGSDAYLLSHVLHDWDDEACLLILENCRKAMAGESRLLVAENIVPPGNAFSLAKLMDLEVLVMGGGKERTAEEFRMIFQTAGFDLIRTVPAGNNLFLLEGTLS